MDASNRMQSIDRRLFLGASASTLLAMPALAQNEAKPAETKPAETKPSAPAPDGKRLSQLIADFVTGLDLKAVPPVVIDRARVAITDTVGVMLAGSHQDVSHILCDMVRLEGATPSASIVGQSLRTSPQLAALANGVAAHAMDYDFTFVAGQAARNGVMAALLGRNGFTAQPHALEGHSGYFEDFGRGLEVTYEPFRDLGRRFDLEVMGYDLKAYPCGGLAHTAIEAALALRERLAPRLADITSIHCSVTRNAGQRAGTQYPQSIENAKFSLSYMVAYSLVHGAPMIGAFTEEAIRDDQVKAVARTVSATVDPALGPGTRESPAILKVTLADGQTFEKRIDYQTGSIQNPMTQAQVEAKFLDCAAQSIKSDVARQILAALNALPARPSFTDFWPLVRLS